MDRHFDSDHESGSTRTAFEALRAARPHVPSEWTSADTAEAEEMFWRIVGDERMTTRHWFRRSHFTLAVGAAAAAAVIGVLTTLPNRDIPVSVGEGATTIPETAPTETSPGSEASMTAWPEIAPSPPVGPAHTARATMTTISPYTSGVTEFTLADGNVNIGLPVGRDENGVMQMVDNRYADGEWYFHFVDEDGEGMGPWQYDPNDEDIFVGLSPSDPRELLDRLSPTAGFEPDGVDFVLGVETVHLVATTPESIDPKSVQYDAELADRVESLELWVDSNGIVRRLGVTYTGSFAEPGDPDPVELDATGGQSTTTSAPNNAGGSEIVETSISIQFYDIGEPITVDAPRDAIEVDGHG